MRSLLSLYKGESMHIWETKILLYSYTLLDEVGFMDVIRYGRQISLQETTNCHHLTTHCAVYIVTLKDYLS